MSGESINYIIIIDGTTSMGQKDFRPNRFRVALKGIKTFMEEKQKVAPDTFYSLLIGGKQTLVLSSLSKDTENIVSQLHSKKHTKNYNLEGENTDLIFTLDIAFEMINEQVKKIGGHRSNMILISSEFDLRDSSKIDSLIEKARALNIQINLFILNSHISDKLLEFYQMIAKKTKGTVQSFNSKKNFYTEIKKYALIKTPKREKPIIQHPFEKSREEHLEEIAQSLRRPNQEELKDVLNSSKNITCKICFATASKMLANSTKKTLRFCPVCDTPLHLYCAGMWSLKTYKKGNLIRCPYCYNLLRVPTSIRRGLKIRQDWEKRQLKEPFFVKMIRFYPEKRNKSQEIFNECHYCFATLDFEDSSEPMYQCSKCLALYHKSCLKEMYEISKKCKNCGGSIV